jgi:hypothetical protein
VAAGHRRDSAPRAEVEAMSPSTSPTLVDYNPNAASVERTRSVTGLMAVVVGDVAIAVAAIIALYEVASSKGTSEAVVSILTSAFTAIGTLTTAYFGIKAASNTASSISSQHAGRNTTEESGGDRHDDGA